MAIKLTTAARNAELDALTTTIGNAALLRIYNGSRPADANTAVSGQTLLAELTCGTPFAGAASSGTLTANSITSDTDANAAGTASWYRLVTSGGTAVLDGDVGTSGADLNLNTTSIAQHATVSVTSWTLTEANG